MPPSGTSTTWEAVRTTLQAARGGEGAGNYTNTMKENYALRIEGGKYFKASQFI